MNNLYEQFVDLVKRSAFEQAERIHRQYRKQASYVYPSYQDVVLGITRMLEDRMETPREIIRIIIEEEGIASKLGAIALGHCIGDEGDR